MTQENREQPEVVETQESESKLAKSEFNSWKYSRASYQPNAMTGADSDLVFTSKVDKMEIPKKYKDLVEVCRFFYKHDPVAGTVINKIVDCCVTPINNMPSGTPKEELAVYDSIKSGLQEFYRNACLEYLLSGLVLPEYEWVRKSGKTIRDIAPQRKVIVPDNLWFRDPRGIEIKLSFLPNRYNYYVKVDRKLVDFIRQGGKKGIIDGAGPEEYKILVDNYPDFVKKIQDAKMVGPVQVLLEDVRPIRSRTLSGESYPIPYMSNALESLMHKRNMRKMDYSIASRVTAAIQLIKMGNDQFPVTDKTDFTYMKDQINYATSAGDSERIFQLFTNHTVTIEWVYPNVEAMLADDKYRSIDDDIISGFGFPRTLITGETLRSNVEGGSDLATFSPLATMEAIRNKFLEWTRELYEEMRTKNKFKSSPIPTFEPMKLYKLIDLNEIGMNLYQEGSLSRTSRLEALGFDVDTEIERMKEEKAKYEQEGLDPAPQLPFSSPKIGAPNNNDTDNRDGTDNRSDDNPPKPSQSKKPRKNS